MAAGFEKLSEFGFVSQLLSRCTGWEERRKLLKVPADYHYLELVHEARVSDCQKELQEIQKGKPN